MEPIFNSVVASIDKPDRHKKIACYTSTNQILTSYIEKGEIQVKSARRKAAFDVWLRILCAILSLNNAGDEELHVLVTVGQSLLTVHGCPDYSWHSNIVDREDRNPGFIMLVSRSGNICMLLRPASYTYVHLLDL